MMLINIFSVLLDTTNDKTYIANLASPEAAPGIMVSQFNRGFESSTISFFNFSILGSNSRFSTNYMTALGLNQAYI